ncbi:hypothetical protein HNV11_04520 [Spirosoma taeanense]|uniref:YfhO family protein n=1 Tax=Spirosoma taeanense TaxID=2735870 RepID=A0A6M5Y7J7_9BACT|nr:DUF6056 family protein [Spirosoma taeanense]QJW88692.1 hypothetical protein HNV11_04520 [Spirosoma taeanense]
MADATPLLRFVTGLLVSFVLILFVPLVVLSFYNHPSPADDYCFANTAMQYGFWRAQQFYYDGWSGRFFHNFLVHSSPLTIGWYDGYKIYPIILLALLLLGFYALASQWLYRFGKGLKLALAAGLFVGFMATLAGLPEFLYWYAGMACYSLSVVLFLFLLATLLAHQRHGFGLHPGYLVGEGLLITAIVGSSETSMVMVISLLAMVAFGELLQRRRVSATILVLLGVGAVACYYLLAAPGNAVRMASNPNSSNIPLTLISSLRFAVTYLGHQLFLTPLLPLSLLYIPVAYQLTGLCSPAQPLPPYLRLHPVWALLHGGATVLALISLHFFGVGIPPVPRLINIINLVFWLSWGYNLTLWVVALRPRLRPDRWAGVARPIVLTALVLTALAVGFGPVLPVAYGDWLSGRAAQYDQAMQQRYDQLTLSTDGPAQLAPLPFYPASLFLEDVKNDPQHLWNRCWADYYHKKTIVLNEAPHRSAQ